MATRNEPDAPGASASSSAPEWYARQWLRLCELLDVQSPQDVVPRVQSLIEASSTGGDTHDADGLVPIDEVEAVLEEMNAEIDRLKTRNRELTAQLESASSPSDSDPDPAPKAEAIFDVLGTDSAEEVAQYLDDVDETIDRLETERDRLQSERDRLAEKHRALREERDELKEKLASLKRSLPTEDLLNVASTLRDTLGIDSAAEARTLAQRIRQMYDRLQALRREREQMADEVGVSDVDDVQALIASMNEQLVDLYEARDAASSDERDAIRTLLGVDTAVEARELRQMVLTLVDEFQSLCAVRQTVQTAGVSSIEEGVDMIESMEQQLTELYRDRERTAQAAASTDLDPEMDLVEQLRTLFAERERLETELGVASADAVITMVRSLVAQLEEVYADRDAGVEPDDETAQMLISMRQQLEALYEEKEVLFDHDLANAQEAVARIERLQERIDALETENDEYETVLHRLRAAIGTEALSAVPDEVDALREEVERLSEARDEPSAADETPARETVPSPTDDLVDTAPPVTDDEVLQSLESMSEVELDALPVGILRLSADGIITFVNEAAVPVPGIPAANERSALQGLSFFETAPGTDRHPFFRRFREGLPDEAMDARFPYVIPQRSGDPIVLAIHLHRKPDTATSWILFRPM